MDLQTSGPAAFGLRELAAACPELAGAVRLTEDPAVPPQGYWLRISDTEAQVGASDEAGLLYGLLDLPERRRQGPGTYRCPGPYIRRRGIKLNLPLDARTPSYSDASDSAFENIPHMWEMDFWTELLDEMARNKFNVLTLWSLSPFPSLVRIPEYPAAALEDVMRSTIPPRPEMSGAAMWTEDMEPGLYPVRRMTMDEKIDFWRRVMDYARQRCVDVYLFTWNLFVYGAAGIPCDQADPVTADYVYCAVKALLRTYPLLAGIGVTAGEHMRGDETDIAFLRRTYGRAVEEIRLEQPGRRIELIHRMQYARLGEIQAAFADFAPPFALSVKYAQAHLHAYPKPVFFQPLLEELRGKARFWLTLRDDDYYLCRWGDYGFARDFLAAMPAGEIEGFYLGADGFTWGRDYTGWGKDHPLYLRKMWYKFSLLGKLAYDLRRPEAAFRRELEARFGLADGGPLQAAWAAASRILALVNSAHWNDYDFQWYPEGCCRFLHPPVGKLVFSDITEFMECRAMPGSPFQSVRDYCLQGPRPGLWSPIETAAELRRLARTVWRLRRQIPEKGGELAATVTDLRLLALLGRYYAGKLEAAAALLAYRLDRRRTEKQREAVTRLRRCARIWEVYAALSVRCYRPQRLTRLGGQRVDFTAFDRWAWLDVELAARQ